MAIDAYKNIRGLEAKDCGAIWVRSSHETESYSSFQISPFTSVKGGKKEKKEMQHAFEFSFSNWGCNQCRKLGNK